MLFSNFLTNLLLLNAAISIFFQLWWWLQVGKLRESKCGILTWRGAVLGPKGIRTQMMEKTQQQH